VHDLGDGGGGQCCCERHDVVAEEGKLTMTSTEFWITN